MGSRFRRTGLWLIGVLVALAAAGAAALALSGVPRLATGMAAKAVCSAVFVGGRSPDGLMAQDVRPASILLLPVLVSVERPTRSATASYLGMAARRAVWRPDRGCVLDTDPIRADQAPAPAPALSGAPWPEGDASLDPGQWGSGIDAAQLTRAIDQAFVGAGDVNGANTRGVAVVHRGRLLVLRHGPGFGPDIALHGWSMTKTVAAMLAYKLAAESGLSLDQPVVDAFRPGREPAWVAAWRRDGHRAIRISDLLFMRDGLAIVENYDPWGNVPRMLWTEPDAAEVGAAAPLEASPATRWRYLSASANVLAAVARGRFERDPEYWAYPRTALFGPIGARTAVIETDPSGNWIASSFMWASTADWARLGELLRLDGRWGGAQVMPPGFLKLAETPALAGGEGQAYGAGTWRIAEPTYGTCRGAGLPADTVAMMGHWGQMVAVIPSREAVVVRLGWTFSAGQFDGCAFLADVLRALPH
jgi:CubicO group peptidase (beta-lactamase class C family)